MQVQQQLTQTTRLTEQASYTQGQVNHPLPAAAVGSNKQAVLSQTNGWVVINIAAMCYVLCIYICILHAVALAGKWFLFALLMVLAYCIVTGDPTSDLNHV